MAIVCKRLHYYRPAQNSPRTHVTQDKRIVSDKGPKQTYIMIRYKESRGILLSSDTHILYIVCNVIIFVFSKTWWLTLRSVLKFIIEIPRKCIRCIIIIKYTHAHIYNIYYLYLIIVYFSNDRTNLEFLLFFFYIKIINSIYLKKKI